jgi:hypothetical protein
VYADLGELEKPDAVSAGKDTHVSTDDSRMLCHEFDIGHRQPSTGYVCAMGERRPDALAGDALLDATLDWREWCYRRVDSIQPLEGDRGRRRFSIDCTPPPDPRLAYAPEMRHQSAINAVEGMVMVPLAYIDKGPLRHFDARDGSDGPMPILGMGETTTFAITMAQRMLWVDKVQMTRHASKVFAEIAGPTTSAADAEKIEQLLRTGVWDGVSVWNDSAAPTQLTQAVINTISQRFLLIGLIDASKAGTRQVLKYSYNWDIEGSRMSRQTAPLVGAGWGPRVLRIVPHMADAARSYHLEFQTPRELRCDELRLPAPTRSTASVGWIDNSRQPVAHAYASYLEGPTGDAALSLSVPARGLRRSATAVAAFTALLVGLMLFLPWAKDVWVNSPDSAAAVLIAVPAAFFGILAAGRENTLVADSLGFLRAVTFCAAIGLFLVAASIVGELNQPLLDFLWGAVTLWNVCAACFLLLPSPVSWVRTKLALAGREVPGRSQSGNES